MVQFFDSIKDVSKNYKKYDVWEQHQADERVQKEHLSKTLEIPEDKVDLMAKRASTVIRAAEIMDARSEDNAENMEQFTESVSLLPAFALLWGLEPANKFFTKKSQAKLSADINALEKELQNVALDEKTRELKLAKIKELNKKILNVQKKVSKKVNIGYIAISLILAASTIIWGNTQQKKASRIGRFQAKQNELKGLENFVVYTPEQLQQAQEIAKTIPDEKKKKRIFKSIVELKDIMKDEKPYKQWLAQKDPQEIEKLKAQVLTPAQLQMAENDKELIVDTVKEINIKAEEYSENVENIFATLKDLSLIIAFPIGLGVNKIMKLLKVNPKIKATVSLGVPSLTIFGMIIAEQKAQKNASRVGRFKARNELLENPSRLMAFTEEEMKSVENIKAPNQKKGFFRKLADNFAFLKTYNKDNKEYKKYKKVTQKENEKLQKAFKQIETTDLQKKEAAALQKKVFLAFDEVDEMSQRYSEDVEAATEIAKSLGEAAWSFGSIGLIALLTVNFIKGKLPVSKWVNGLTNFVFDSKSSIKKSVNGVWEVLKKQDKAKVQEFQRSWLNEKDFQIFLNKPENKAIADAMEPLNNEITKLGMKGFDKMITEGNGDASKIFQELLNKHFKQTPFAKWARSLTSQIAKLWTRAEISKKDIEITKEELEKLGMNFTYKNYNTLINTGIVGAAPILGVILGVPYAFEAWLTNIQKKAGKIGIMKAMEQIDDPRVFANAQGNDI